MLHSGQDSVFCDRLFWIRIPRYCYCLCLQTPPLPFGRGKKRKKLRGEARGEDEKKEGRECFWRVARKNEERRKREEEKEEKGGEKE